MSEENIKEVLSHPGYAENLARAITLLSEQNLFTDENYYALKLSKANCVSMAKCLIHLSRQELLTPENYSKLIEHVSYVDEIEKGIHHLDPYDVAQYQNSYRNPLMASNLELLFSHPNYADRIAIALVSLSRRKDLLNESKAIIIKYSKYADKLASALLLLHENSINTNENCDAIQQRPEISNEIADLFVILSKFNMLSNEVRQRIATVDTIDVSKIKECVVYLEKAELLSNNNLMALFNRANDVRYFSIGLSLLSINGHLVQSTFDTIMNHYNTKHPLTIAKHNIKCVYGRYSLMNVRRNYTNVRNIYTTLLQGKAHNVNLRRLPRLPIHHILFWCASDQATETERDRWAIMQDTEKFFSTKLNRPCLF